MAKKPQVAILIGSSSDLDVIKETENILNEFGISYVLKVLSAHRTADETIKFAKNADKLGIKVIIAGAGGSAHLAGTIAAHTTLPVIGVPMETQHLKGIDSLFSTVQMPSGVPVGCMSIGKAGAKNAAIFCVQILSASDKKLKEKLKVYKDNLKKAVLKK